MMEILVTAGSTNTMIDQTHCISNIFKERTGYNIANYFSIRGEKVSLVTSNPIINNFLTKSYKTYDELFDLMKYEIENNLYDVIIHSAVVSDYKVEGTYIKTSIDNHKIECVGGIYISTFTDNSNISLKKIDLSTKILPSNEKVYIKLVSTEKIIDKIKSWGFKGKLVEFKLQVGISDEELLYIAMKSCKDSGVDFIVVSCLEWAKERAYIVDKFNNVILVSRLELPEKLYNLLK